LTIPTSAQWEYAARAGTHTAYWPGADEWSLRGVANVYDRSRALADDPVEGLEFDDGYCFHAPVGSFVANPFGLHDVHGNVWEWVRDRFGSDETPVRAGDGERLAAEGPFLVRGGSFGDTANCAVLVTGLPVPRETELYSNFGFRPARELRAATAAEDEP